MTKFILSINYKPVTWPVNDITNHHHFTRGIPGTNFKIIKHLEIEILGEGYEPTFPCTFTGVEKTCTLEGLT